MRRKKLGGAGPHHRGLEEEDACLLLFEVRSLLLCGVGFFGDQVF
jgi:hypothetical protein